MSEIKLINQKNTKALTSLEVAEMVEKEHKNLLRDIRNYIDVISTSARLSPLNYFIESTYQDAKNETRPMYLLTKQGCEVVANKMTGEKGILFTAMYVQKFNEMELQRKLPKTYKEALLALVAAEEEKELMIPKVEFYDRVTQSTDLLDIKQVASILNLGYGRNTLFAKLRALKILDQYNMPYQKYIDQGLFKVVETKKDTKLGVKVFPKTCVYQKGLDYIRKVVS